ncbi:hypothetical protein [Rhizobium leguminosarum]|uniref:Uncharacterized protein n=1 Tax=Rhizobium leguminosarum TaxID=384 RepID=A0A7K3VHZ2_RHILE|nr:hypothetical protein [Rhizobium leguminosarum]NEK15701.1 hypothetical protein [Rhizobium leguminosarum]
MFFNRSKPQNEPAPRTGLTDGIEDKIATFVREWGALKRSKRTYTPDGTEPVLKLLTDADTALFVKAMEDETAAIEVEINAEIAAIKRSTLAAIAQKDAEIAAINRDIEATKARIAAQDDEIDRRASSLVSLVQTAEKIDPMFKIDSLDTARAVNENEIRKEIVRRKFGAIAVDGKSEAYIDERFESLAARVNVDPFARVVADGLAPTSADGGKAAADKAYADYVRSLQDAHKGTQH